MEKEDLLRLLQSHFIKKYMVRATLIIEGETPLPELQVHPVQNFETKATYIDKAYNENLVHNFNSNIKITGFFFEDDRGCRYREWGTGINWNNWGQN